MDSKGLKVHPCSRVLEMPLAGLTAGSNKQVWVRTPSRHMLASTALGKPVAPAPDGQHQLFSEPGPFSPTSGRKARNNFFQLKLWKI